MSDDAAGRKRSREVADLLSESSEILALGLTRLLARKSSEFPPQDGESLLHFSPDQSGGRPIPENGEEP